MVGVKRLILEARDVEAPLSPTDTTLATSPISHAPASEPAQHDDARQDEAPADAVTSVSDDVSSS